MLRSILLLEHDPRLGTPLVDESTGYRAIVSSDDRWRVIYDIAGDVVTVRELWASGARADGEAYAEALQRMQSADPPDLVQLASIVRRLGRVTGSAPVPRNRLRRPVPDWLADALVQTAGRSALEVAALDAVSAFDAWNRHLGA